MNINLTGIEKTSNKKSTLTDNSDTFYPTQKAVKTAVDSKFNNPTGTTSQYIRGDGSFQTFPTIPDASDFVAKSDYTPAHSVLVQQSGTGSPTSVQIGTNEILGRKSGGGSDIEGLSVSEVKSILNYTSSELLTALGWFTKQRTSESTEVTGTTTETIVDSFEIPSNIYTASGGILRVYNNKYRKVGIAGAYTLRLYLSVNNNNISGASLLATCSFASTIVLGEFLRTFTFDGTKLIGFNSALSAITDVANSAWNRTETTMDRTINNYIIFTVQLAKSGDSVTALGNSIKNF